MKNIIIALDIGGTKCSAACFEEGQLGPVQKMETLAHLGPKDVLKRILLLLENTLAAAHADAPAAIAAVCPGVLSLEKGRVIHAPMLGWRDEPVRDILSRHFHCPALLENDANAAAYGEYKAGAGQGTESAAYITVSTGVGCGLVVHDRILHGAHGGAAELGHLHLFDDGRPCRCGRSGCLQTLASGTSIAEIAREKTGIQHLTALDVAIRAREGDETCMDVYRQAGDALGRGISALSSLVDPGRIIIGGSVSAQLDLLLPGIKDRLRQSGCPQAEKEGWIVPAALQPHSGLMGGALLAREML